MLLVVAHVRQHTLTYLVEQVFPRLWQGVGGLEESLTLGVHDSREERPLVREVVVHQRPRNAGTLGDLIDAYLVVRALAEDLRAQRQQLVAAVVGGQPTSGLSHAPSLVNTCQTAPEVGTLRCP